MPNINNVELGTIISAEEIGQPGQNKYMAVVCSDPSGEKGCGDKRWARYFGPFRHSPTKRLCAPCNKRQASKNFQVGKAFNG